MSQETKEFCAIEWLSPTTAIRRTKEVQLRCEILDYGKRISLTGTGDLTHHLIEDAAIFMRKIAQEKCGEGH